MLPLADFGIESSGLNLAVDLLIVFVVVLYLALVYWTYADARRRIYDPMLIGCATVSSLLFPFVGVIVYTVVRPPEYLEDVREREMETRAAEARLHELGQSLCPHCDYRIERDFIRCPSCLRKLKERCVSCSRPLDQAWTICPYCEADVPGLSTSRARRRRGASALAGELADVVDEPLRDGASEEPDATRAIAAASSPEGDPGVGSAEARAPSAPRASRRGGRPRPTA